MLFSKRTAEGVLDEPQIRETLATALEHAGLGGKRVLVIVPDGTRSGPIGLFFRAFCELLLPQVGALDFLIALGTHPPMEDEAIRRRWQLTPEEWERYTTRVHVFNHEWWKPQTFCTPGVIPAEEIAELSGGLLRQEVPVRLNRKVLEYDQVIICGPVFPHEVVGFSGGSKYFFPGISGPEVINVTHWLGALLTSFKIIGTKDTAVRAVIERAAAMVQVPVLACCLVVKDEGVAGLYLGPRQEAWARAADHSAQVHVTYLDRPVQRVLSIMPAMYDDIWTAAKGMYKAEPVVADGGEVIIYAPHITEFSYTHGKIIEEIGYHVRDYFVKQWDRFKHYPWGVLAHSTHLRGMGEYDAATGIESPRIQVTLATGIPAERCARVNLGYLDPCTIRPEEWLAHAEPDTLVIPKAGEQLYRLRAQEAPR